jgi:hypothetical protein
MKKLALIATVGAASLALAACDQQGNSAAENNMSGAESGLEPADNGAMAVEGNGSASAGAAAGGGAFPKGARIVEENGVTYRIDADGSRVALTDRDSRIVTENGVRYRVDSDGSRVRIDPRGATIDVDLPDVTPDVDVGINKKGNPDIDVKTNRDGNDGPN